jgi:hypothetical protein
LIAYTDDKYISHLKSKIHIKNENKLKGNIDLSLYTIKELHQISSKTLDENQMYRINNYTRLKKTELIKQMNAIYDLLVFE